MLITAAIQMFHLETLRQHQPHLVQNCHVVADRFGIQLDMANKDHHSSTAKISNDIYLNATEEAITELLGGGVQSKSYNFDFYTKVDLKL